MRTLAFAAAVAFALLSLTAARAATPDTLLPVAIAADEPATEETADASAAGSGRLQGSSLLIAADPVHARAAPARPPRAPGRAG